MNELFTKIVNLSLGALPLIAAVLILRAVLKNAPKSMRTVLWALAAFKLSCPFSIKSKFSLLTSNPVKIAPSLIESGGNGAILVSLSDTAEPGIALSGWLSYIWLAGLCALLFYAVFSYLRLRNKTAVSMRTEDNVYLCDYIDSAFILGIIKPKIFIPSDFGADEMQFIIAHERMHLKRLDQIWKLLGYIILMLHWFNPLVWVSYLLFCRDLELSCDESVIKNMELSEKKEYSRALLISSLAHRGLPGCPPAFAEIGVKARIKAVLNYRKPGIWIIAVSVLACTAAALFFISEPEKSETIIEATLHSPAEQDLSLRLSDKKAPEPTDARLPLPGEGGSSQLIEKGENSIKVSFFDGEITYTVLSARLEENKEGMEHCLLIKFSVLNEDVPEGISHLANCFNVTDGRPWSDPDRYFIEPGYLDIAKSKPSKENKGYFIYDFPANGESREFTLGYELDEAGVQMLKDGKLYLDYNLDEIRLPLLLK